MTTQTLVVLSPLLFAKPKTKLSKKVKIFHHLLFDYLSSTHYFELITYCLSNQMELIIPHKQSDAFSITVLKENIAKRVGRELSKKITYLPINYNSSLYDQVLLYPRDFFTYIPEKGYFVGKKGKQLFNAIQSKFTIMEGNIFYNNPLAEGGRVIIESTNKIIATTNDLKNEVLKYFSDYYMLILPKPSDIIVGTDTYRVDEHIDQYFNMFTSDTGSLLCLVDGKYANAIVQKGNFYDKRLVYICKTALQRNIMSDAFAVNSHELKVNPINIITLPNGSVISGSLGRFRKLKQWFIFHLSKKIIFLDSQTKQKVSKAGLRCYTQLLTLQ